MIGNYYTMSQPSLMQDPNHIQNVKEQLAAMGFDVSALFPQEIADGGTVGGFAGPLPGTPGNPNIMPSRLPKGGAPASGTAPPNPYTIQTIPGGSGWDGVNQKLAWLAQRAQYNRDMKRQMQPRQPAGAPGMGSPSDIERFQSGMGSRSNQEMRNFQGGGAGGSLFSKIGRMLGI